MIFSAKRYLLLFLISGNIHQNETHFCIDLSGGNNYDYYSCKEGQKCVELKAKCDGILDFVSTPEMAQNSTRRYGQEIYFADETDCNKDRFTPIFVSIFGLNALVIVSCVAIWILTFNSVPLVVKMVLNTFKRVFSDHVPLVIQS